MKQLHKDIALLCINNIGISIIHVWTIIYPYYSSYLHSLDDSITASKIFAATIFFYIGSLIGNFLNPYFISVLGYRNMIFWGGCLNLYWAFITTTKISIPYILFGWALLGYIKVVIWDSNNVLIAEKYSNHGGLSNIRFIHMFRYFFSCFVILFTQFYINPDSKSAITIENNQKVFP